MKQIEQEHFLNSFFALLDETFENHHGIYLDKNTSLFQTLETVTAEWGEIWRTVEKVTTEEWEACKTDLEQSYRRIDRLLRENETWNEDAIGGAMAIVVHIAYHLGEIRQALCTLK